MFFINYSTMIVSNNRDKSKSYIFIFNCDFFIIIKYYSSDRLFCMLINLCLLTYIGLEG